MPFFYLDASAIVKRYRSERGTEVIDELLNRSIVADRFYTSYLSVLEVTSAVRRLVPANRLTTEIANEMLGRFDRDVLELFRLWLLDDEVITEAISFVSRHLLRSADAIHLATASHISALAQETVTIMVASDRELLAASERSGLTVLNPESPNGIDILTRIRESTS